ncbi:carboxylate/amino acid/amine transporter [Tritonibacter multivorans]|uniref:Carboxylate/amino acid/amine transporter n=1 Tax=Tritonibacter multivorans TaxID=928856 RepID=A0A0P1G534_9RHOB|nr:DMT family transporter [Tritonibacter multivorans]MDA7421818.1 DMT family transporter [Tritonibacter multivorans]CUH76816.1 carboxylate/amino acid/amine transporter [Tritonibacter multivorans]SFD06441.1 Permease of the drug/metabolite transporter (DMT) superfamily [Tritonibacter multivorans]
MTQTKQNPTLAMAFILTATVFLAGTTLMAKFLGTDALGDPLHPLQISNGRFIFAFIGISTAVLLTRQKISRPNWGLHVGRSTLGWGGVSLMFASVAYIPLADATAISFLNPIFGMLFAIPFLGERIGPWRWLAAALAIFGAMVLLRPTPDSFQPAALLALGAAVGLGAELIFIKKLAGREPPLQVLWVNNLIGLGISSVVAFSFWQMPSPAQWAVMIGLGLIMACAQICFVNAMARAEASFVAPFTYATLVFAALYDAVAFGQLPDFVTVIGAGIILTGGVLLAWREAVNRAGAKAPRPSADIPSAASATRAQG